MVDLTDTAKFVCSINYKSNCGDCGLRTACCNRRKFKNLDEWTQAVNDLADKVMKEASQ